MTDWPSEDAGNSATLFVRGLPYTWTDLDLSAHFEHIGPIRRAFIVHQKHTNTSKGFGFVQFALHDDAQRGAQEMDGKELGEGRKLRAELAVKGAGKGKGGAGVGEKRKEAAKAETAQTKRQKVETATSQQQQQQTMVVDEHKEVMEPTHQEAEAEVEANEDDGDSETSEDEDNEDEEQASAVKAEAEVKRAPAAQKQPTHTKATTNKVKHEQDDEVSHDGETAMTDDHPSSAALASSAPSPRSASHALLVTGFPASATSISDILKQHSLHPTLVVFPAPESTLKRKAARLTFPTATLASQAATALSSTTLPAASAPLRCVALPSNAARLIVRNLPFHIGEPQLRKLLSPYGAITSLLVPVKAAGGGSGSGSGGSGSGTVLNRGFGFVCYVRMEDAAAMMKAVNSKPQWGRQLAVDWSLDKQQYGARLEMAAKKEKVKDMKKEKKAIKAAGGDEEEHADRVKKQEDEAEEDQDVDMVKDEDEAAEDSGMEEDDDNDGSDGDEQGDDEKSSDDEDEATTAPLSPASSTASSSSSSAASPRAKPTRPNPSTDSDADCTLFIRNLAYETTEQSLFQKFSLFGGVKYARIVMERFDGPAKRDNTEDDDKKVEDDTPKQRSKGVAFVRYYNKADADKVLAICQQTATTAGSDREKRMPSLVTLSESGIVLDNRQLNVVLAVDKRQASQLSAASTQKQDKRNLYLAREGVILPSSAGAANVMGEDELKRRERYYREKKKKLDNPNFMVSRCRLSLRNLPMECEEKAVKKIMMAAVKLGRREERQQEREDLRRAQEDGSHKAEDEDKKRRRHEAAQEREALRRAAIVIRQVKVVRDAERAGAGGLGRSKRYGFIEFNQHEAALTALRTINAHSELWKEVGGLGGAAGGRVMVEFAVDDVRKVKEREERQRRLEKMREIKANMIADKERAATQQEQQGEEARTVADDGVEKGAPTQKDKKRQAREAGVCYKCGEAGHQAKRCKKRKAGATTTKAEGAEANVVKDGTMTEAANADRHTAGDKKKGKTAKAPQPATANGQTATTHKKRGGDEAGQQAVATQQKAAKKAKVTNTEAAAAVDGTAVQAVAGKRRREDSAVQKLSKREKRELAGEAKFEAMVSEYKKKFLDTSQPAVSKGDGVGTGTAAATVGGDATRKKPVSRWFDV